MPRSTKSGFLSSYFRSKEPCGSLFRQVLFVLQAVPDVLDVIIVFQCIQQLAHQLQLIGVGQAGGCLLYTSDAADEEDRVEPGGPRIIKKKEKGEKKKKQ